MNKFPDPETYDQERCICCGRFGYSYDIGPFYEGKRKLFLCADCTEEIQENLHRGQDKDFPAAALWMAAADEGGLFLYGQEPQDLGMTPIQGHGEQWENYLKSTEI